MATFEEQFKPVIKSFEPIHSRLSKQIAASNAKALYDSLPINAQNEEIRLLRIVEDDSSSNEDRLECSMEVASLNTESLDYLALSYCWGPPDFDYEITCNGYAIAVTRNLSLALLSFRNSIRRLPIWVDQVCINQSDLDERASQVMIMRSIYSKCTICMCHIGEKDEAMEIAMSYIPYRLRKMGREPLDKVYGNYDGIFLDNAVFDFAGMQALLQLAQRPYFTRTWIIQEMAVSNINIVACDTLSFFWDDFQIVFEERVVSQISLGIFTTFGRFNFMEVNQIVQQLSSLHQYRMGVKFSHEALDYVSKLIALTCRGRNFKASDPRDKIFALQGIAVDGHLFSAPDYRKSVELVYQEFAEVCCSQGYSLYCLELAGLGTSQYALPSWVPDWTSEGQFVDPSLFIPVDSTHESGEDGYRKVVLSQAIKLGDGNTLHISCFRIGTVTKVLNPSPAGASDDGCLLGLLTSAKHLVTSVMASGTGSSAPWEIIYKLITSGRREGSRCYVRKNSRVQSPKKFAKMMQDHEEGRMKSLYELAVGNELGRLPFEKLETYQEVSEHGDLRDQRDLATQPFSELQGYTIGLVDSYWPARIPNSSKLGDIVIYIQDTIAPSIIRKAPGVGYYFIGTAYVEGRMENMGEQEELETILVE
jgi:hypothetical protein